MLTPFRADLDKIGITYNFSIDHYDTYYDLFKAYSGPLPYGKFPSAVRFNSRIIGRGIVSTSDGISKLTDALQFVVEDTVYGAAWTFVCQVSPFESYLFLFSTGSNPRPPPPPPPPRYPHLAVPRLYN